MNGLQYTYKKNIQGDIVGIYDSNNVLICKYIYDAWGNHKTLILYKNANNIEEYVDINENSEYNIVCKLNPFRYRSYYYDVETKLYYLNSRYYDPELGRFINADSIDNIDKENLNGFNLYMYCADNPIANIDAFGDVWWNPFTWKKETWMKIGSSLLAIGGAALVVATGGLASVLGGGLLAAGIGSLVGGYTNQTAGGSFAAGWTGGLISGFFAGIGAGFGGLTFNALTHTTSILSQFALSIGMVGIPMLGGFTGNVLGTMAKSKIDNTSIDWNQTLTDSLLLGFFNIFAGFGAGVSNALGESVKRFVRTTVSKIVAFGVEGLYDYSSYLYDKINKRFQLRW